MANHLAQETSPYLLQHADNPVEWYPWSPEALEQAQDRDKPILLSVGYSACHWCHVMAHESFEDPATAELMNRLFVNIKVDREERPDIDRIYQMAQQMFSGRAGGWPLTVFLTPEQIPIFAGTYFPREAKYGMPSFATVLTRVESYYRERPDEIRDNGERLVEALAATIDTRQGTAPALTKLPIETARANLAASFDAENGGFGTAPKFPHPSNLEFLLEQARASRESGQADRGSLAMCTQTLDAMSNRGLYDHLGGGFFRYCVDAQWTIPHFEKMLYDNAALLGTYADAFAATGTASYAEVANGTADWILRDMQAHEGGYFSTLDADSDGHEGAFYVWRPAELETLLTSEERAVVEACFGLDGAPNFEGESWHLLVARSLEAVAALRNGSVEDSSALLASARAKMLAARNARVWPGRDEKVLVAWNGLVIAGMAKASRQLRRQDLVESAERAVEFIRQQIWDGTRLKASYKDGRARFEAYLDDYAFLSLGLLELLECRWSSGDLEFARGLLDSMLSRFADPAGGFFFTADDHERLIHRPKPLADEALPSGNGIAALALQRLGHLLGEPRYLEAAERTLEAAWPLIERYPEAHTTLLRVLARQLEPPELLVVRGSSVELEQWRQALGPAYRPERSSYFIPSDCRELPGLLGARSARDGPVAYFCRGTECEAPIGDIDALTAIAH